MSVVPPVSLPVLRFFAACQNETVFVAELLTVEPSDIELFLLGDGGALMWPVSFSAQKIVVIPVKRDLSICGSTVFLLSIDRFFSFLICLYSR
jgi:hypothetical protein